MTLKEVFDALNNIALSQPDINGVIKSGNIYDINEDRDINYSVFCAVQGTHSYDFINGENTFNFILYYVDRLQSDGDNKTEVQSAGIEALKNILRAFIREYDVDIPTVSIDVFTESFAALCAGAYATVSIQVEDDNCYEEF